MEENDNLAIQLATACSRSAVPAEAHQRLRAAFPGCKLIRCASDPGCMPARRSGASWPSHLHPIRTEGVPKGPVACQLRCSSWAAPWRRRPARAGRQQQGRHVRRQTRALAHPTACARPSVAACRLSFGLQNKVMVSITVDLQGSGATHASYVPIHPTAAAAAVLQNQPIMVVREHK